MYEKIIILSDKLKSKIIKNYDIAKLTWFRTGGKADLFCIVDNESELEIILNNLENIPYQIIGAGSNLLIRDGGYRGLIIKLGKSFNELKINNNNILAGGSILDSNLSKFAYLNSIKNFEFFSGIPGSVGGAVMMNAGCYGSETKDLLQDITVMNNNGKISIVKKNDLNLSYRNSNLRNKIVLKAKFKANKGHKEEILKEVNKIKKNREISQPIKKKTSGSTFKNPSGFYAAKLIEEAGCKGFRRGDAMVSDLHSNFFINTNKASASEIEDLGKLIIDKVYEKFQIILEWEIKIIGELKK